MKRRSLWLDGRRLPEVQSAFPADGRYDVLVVGAGLTGLITALLLARSGTDVGVIEARRPGAGASGNTTGKLSLLQGTVLSELRRHRGAEGVRAYLTANRAGQEWLTGYLTDHGVALQQRPAVDYASTPSGLRRLRAELTAAVEAGIPARWADPMELPFPVAGAIELPDQGQFDPFDALSVLLADLAAAGGRLHLGVRMRGLRVAGECRVATSAGPVQAGRLVLATGAPILDRGLYFARHQALRSYLVSFDVSRVREPIPGGMYLSVDRPNRSLRTVPGLADELLLVGGNGHVVGRRGTVADPVGDLVRWTARVLPGARPTHAWSAQDYRPATRLPVIGPVPFAAGRVLVATGYNKWGLANAAGAALALAGTILGDPPGWAGRPPAGRLSAADLGSYLHYNGGSLGRLATGWLGVESRSLPDAPAEGTGVTGRLGMSPAARSTVNGSVCTVSAICTHLGGIVSWNESEQSWDCPLHGSRFTADGSVLEGPAVHDLASLD